MGSLVHFALERFWQNKKATEMDIISALNEWSEDNPYNDARDEEIYLAQARAMMAGYWNAWHRSREDWEYIGVEGPVRMELEGTGYEFVGKFDALATYIPQDKKFLIEHKTTSEDIERPDAFYWLRLQSDKQLTGYKAAKEREIGEEIGLLYDVLRKPTGRGPKMKSRIVKRKTETQEEFELRKADATESFFEYQERLEAEYVEAPGTFFARREIFRTLEDLEEWEQELITTIKTVEQFKASDIFPRNDGHCKRFGSVCPYFGVCNKMESIDSGNFKDKESKHVELPFLNT